MAHDYIKDLSVIYDKILTDLVWTIVQYSKTNNRCTVNPKWREWDFNVEGLKFDSVDINGRAYDVQKIMVRQDFNCNLCLDIDSDGLYYSVTDIYELAHILQNVTSYLERYPHRSAS